MSKVCFLILMFFVPLYKSFQDSSDSFRQTEKATAGEAGVRSRGGEDQKGNTLLTHSDPGVSA